MQTSERHMKIAILEDLIRDVPDFPKPGIVFKDITPLLADPAGLSLAVEYLTQPFRSMSIDVVIGAESRGFIFGTAVARNLSAGFVPIRKPGKLPRATRSEEYALEYGVDKLEIHEDAIKPGMNVLMIDDLLATGGTMAACCRMVESLGGTIVAVAVFTGVGLLERPRSTLELPDTYGTHRHRVSTICTSRRALHRFRRCFHAFAAGLGLASQLHDRRMDLRRGLFDRFTVSTGEPTQVNRRTVPYPGPVAGEE